MKSIGPFGKINTRVLVEMWMLPRIKTFDRAIPLDCFVPIQRDHLQLVKSRVSGIGETLHPMLNETAVQPEYKHVLLLCPREVKPTVIVIKKHQRQPQQSVKAYVLDTVEATTLVSVKESDKKTWLLIPYYPEMYVWEAKQYIQKFFGDVIVVACNLSGQASDLDDGSTMLESGVRSYEHSLSMKISSFV
ncbi:hypothetical protein DFH11DRAFT_1510462 [Phellopilus nigrolimitatus]|nr:hypothetical protein DFH11DRAFT_1510462 [Phellopilus nigrolimitatus]